MAIQMQLSRIFIREMTDLQFIELQELDGERAFPIAIGLPEAQAIERRLKGIEPPRPQTHDLLASIIESMDCRLDQIIINDLNDNTFFAKLLLTNAAGETVEIDSRPSDAIALGVATDLPIYAEESVLERAAMDDA